MGGASLEYAFLIVNAEDVSIEALTIVNYSGSSVLINIQNSTEVSINKNTIGNGVEGVSVDFSSTNVSITNNYIGVDNLGNVLTLSFPGANLYGDSNCFAGNVVGNTGYYVTFSGDNNVIENNFLGIHPNGSQHSTISNLHGILGDGHSAVIRNNQIGNAGLGIRLYGDSNVVSNNLIGIDSSGNIHSNLFPAIVLEAGADNNSIFGNAIAGNNMDGVYNSGLQNKISQNAIYNNGASNLAISLVGGVGNNNHPSPVIVDHNISGVSITLSGTATAGDSVELFLSNGSSENAIQYLSTVVADASGDWQSTYTSPDYYPDSNFAAVATATDINGNTSEFSNLYSLMTTCTVINTNDDGYGSLRAAAVCVDNSLLPVNIVFNISPNSTEEDTIVLTSGAISLNKKCAVDATSESGYVSGRNVVRIKTTGYGFHIFVDGVTIEGFTFEGGQVMQYM